MKSQQFVSGSKFKVGMMAAAIGLAAALALGGCGKKDAPKSGATTGSSSTTLTTDEQKVSYGIAYNMASQMLQGAPFTIDKDAFRNGLNDALAGNKVAVSEADMEKAFAAVQQKAMTAANATAEKNLADGKAFLATNKAKAGVKTTASGLQYEVIKSGSGPKPKATDRVSVHYHGTLLDGSVFDSSVERKEPAEFALNEVIPGWTEGLQLMSVGGKFKFYVPAELGYGPRARGSKIPGNSVLVFEVELLGIK